MALAARLKKAAEGKALAKANAAKAALRARALASGKRGTQAYAALTHHGVRALTAAEFLRGDDAYASTALAHETRTWEDIAAGLSSPDPKNKRPAVRCLPDGKSKAASKELTGAALSSAYAAETKRRAKADGRLPAETGTDAKVSAMTAQIAALTAAFERLAASGARLDAGRRDEDAAQPPPGGRPSIHHLAHEARAKAGVQAPAAPSRTALASILPEAEEPLVRRASDRPKIDRKSLLEEMRNAHKERAPGSTVADLYKSGQ